MTTSSRSMLEYVDQYITHKRGLGYKLGTESFLLRSFARYADAQAPGQPFTVTLALTWATAPSHTTRLYHAKRLDAVRSFARYLVTLAPDTQIPPGGLLGPSYARSTPHIYTDEEIMALMVAAYDRMADVQGARANPIRNATITGLLACTGMRIGEVLALDNRDVDLAQGIITIRESKNLPMRLVPVTENAVAHLRQYQAARDACFGVVASPAFFLSSWSGRLSYASFHVAFAAMRTQAGLVSDPVTGRLPRLHDLRHTFACRHLLRAYQEARDIDSAVHDLAVYLGHARLEATYWYLTGIPVLFEECMKRFTAPAARPERGGAA